ncbi:superoxide dismutase [Amycolatopsis minnesotensis]|uniref:Superoxide dismutase n=1 Tax=Amycolatopsis minnesotensis TaxID=337894 RepID=A0ABN2SV60_9PSEU
MRFLPAALSALALTAFAATPADATPASTIHTVSVHGTFGAYRPGATASTYQPALVPPGSSAHVFSISSGTLGTSTALAVSGLVPGHHYGAHVHTKPCGATGDAAGPHYQFAQDPVTPSVDPAYANPRNEIWLDFTADATGTGFARSRVGWQFGERRAGSVVIHESHTHTDPGHAGTAGARLACVTAAF